MDSGAFKRFVLPWVTMGLTVLGKYVVPPVMTIAGIKEAEAQSWWTATAAVLGGLVVGGITSWLTRRKILQTAEAVADAKIAEYDAAPDVPKAPG